VTNEMEAFLTVRSKSDFFKHELLGFRIILSLSLLLLIMFLTNIHVQSSKRKILEDANIKQLQLAANVLGNIAEGVVVTDTESSIVSVNKAVSAITGYSEKEIIGQKPSVWKSQHHDESFYQEMWRSLSETLHWQGEIWNRRKNGETYPEWISISLVYDDAGEVSHFIAIFSDISDIKVTEAHIEFLANYDPLTQLPNRRLFIDRLDQAIKTADREKSRLAVLFFDLDHFKTINDSLGHSIGDQMLIEVGARISDCMREIDSVSRLSGDEFAAVISDISEVGDVITVANKIIESIRNAFKIRDYELHVTISIGISVYPSDGENYEILLKNADTAMYCAKNSGRDNFEFFSPSMSTQALERLALEGSLRKAVENKELLVFYQPQIQIDTGKIVGMEALLRWPHPEMGMIPPDKFIPLAEETGLIIPIGKWVLIEACRQNKAWQEQGLTAVPVAVNLSAVQFRQHNLLEIVQETLLETGLKACFLELELTESLLMDCSEYNITLLREFRRLGVHLSIDDFGTGYSNLEYLTKFNVDILKIDRSFIEGIPHSKGQYAIVLAIINMAKALGLKVVAEGIETDKQLNALKKIDCHYGQGYFWSKALPANDLLSYLDQESLNAIKPIPSQSHQPLTA
ncbi:MAG: EAL domain-containing protein, partial [Thiotrichaceae bacterium]|nr:EAL domain-containing protein [Thiotrichaceae bacterium]